MTDYFIFSWLQLSKHFKGHKQWSWEFHWKGSNAWYHNFRKIRTEKARFCFIKTKLTLRFGKRLMVIGGFDMVKYYRDVKVLKIKHGGKITYRHDMKPALGDTSPKINIIDNSGKVLYNVNDVNKAIDKMQKDYKHLSKDYPSDTWRN